MDKKSAKLVLRGQAIQARMDRQQDILRAIVLTGDDLSDVWHVYQCLPMVKRYI